MREVVLMGLAKGSLWIPGWVALEQSTTLPLAPELIKTEMVLERSVSLSWACRVDGIAQNYPLD